LNPLGLFLEHHGPLLMHLHTVYMAYSECLPTRLNPLAERTCFSQATDAILAKYYRSLRLWRTQPRAVLPLHPNPFSFIWRFSHPCGGRAWRCGLIARPLTKIVQGWPKFWANFRALIGIFSQSVGPSLAIWANPVKFSFLARRTPADPCAEWHLTDKGTSKLALECQNLDLRVRSPGITLPLRNM
jgi:hypothetical protein